MLEEVQTTGEYYLACDQCEEPLRAGEHFMHFSYVPAVLTAAALNAGWTTDENTGQWWCPKCSEWANKDMYLIAHNLPGRSAANAVIQLVFRVPGITYYVSISIKDLFRLFKLNNIYMDRKEHGSKK